MRPNRGLIPGAALMLALFASCGILDSAADELVVTNRADAPWIAFVVNLESTPLLDPVLRFDVAGNEDAIIAPGASRTFAGEEVDGGYARGDHVTLFLYEVIGAEAVLEETRTVRHSELTARRFRIDIP